MDFSYKFNENELPAAELLLMPLYKIDMGGDDDKEIDDNVDEEKELEELRKVQDNIGQGNLAAGELEEFANRKEEDKNFKRFQKVVQAAPEQIIRHQRGAVPLWVTTDNVPTEIPPCQYCGSSRIFEFQIMPQLLSFLNLDSVGQSVDWGTLAVYTCEKSCDQDEAYKHEFMWKQVIHD